MLSVILHLERSGEFVLLHLPYNNGQATARVDVKCVCVCLHLERSGEFVLLPPSV